MSDPHGHRVGGNTYDMNALRQQRIADLEAQVRTMIRDNDDRLNALRDLIEGDAYELGSMSWWDAYHEIMHADPSVRPLPPVDEHPVTMALASYEAALDLLQRVIDDASYEELRQINRLYLIPSDRVLPDALHFMHPVYEALDAFRAAQMVLDPGRQTPDTTPGRP